MRRSLFYYRKIHIWVILGTAVSTAILVGALTIGDSVRFSLRQIVFDRLGKTEFALNSGDRFFRTQIASQLSERLATPVAPLLQTKGIAVVRGGQQRLSQVQVNGVDSNFGKLGDAPDLYDDLSAEDVVINLKMAAQLGVEPGDDLLLRIQRLDFMPKDAPLALETESSIAKRFKVKAIAGDKEFGRFNLNANQVAPYTAFVALAALSEMMELDNRANTLLVSQRPENPLTQDELDNRLRSVWCIADAGYEIRELSERATLELRSSRIFLDAVLVDAVLDFDKNAQIVLTYFVNEISRGDRNTPYSFVSAISSFVEPLEMTDEEIIVNDWLAQDLDAKVGDQIQLTYYVLGEGRQLVEQSSGFYVRGIVPMTGDYADKTLLPDFPGLAEIENSRDWNPGIPIDLDRIRDIDEEYWHNHRGTPKAFITLNTAQRLWENRFGNSTAIRFHEGDKDELENELRKSLNPASFGFVFHNVREEGLRASSQSVDFSQLFLGLSFFIILAALLLTGLLFVFNVENRSEENGLFLALGFTQKAVKRLVLREGAVLVVVGSLLGSIAGMLYNQVLLYALKTIWHGAVGTSNLTMYFRPITILMGTSIGVVVAFMTLWLMAGKQVKQSISGLQKGLMRIDTLWKNKPNMSLLLGMAAVVAVFVILALTDFDRGREAFAYFFIAGFLLIVGGMLLINVLLYGLGARSRNKRMGLIAIGIRSNARKRLRSLTLIGLLACGLFIVFTVGANRQNALKDARKRDSGTGGFALFGQSSIPVLYDLNTLEGRQFYGLEGLESADVSYVPFRVKEGDDASCLNLNRVSQPQLIGVNPQRLIEREAFTFVKTTAEVDAENPWAVLQQDLPDGHVPAIADNTVIVWGLGKRVGDTLEYRDESGNLFYIKLVGGLANSIFQGNIIISDSIFKQKYPSISGYRLFLIDAPFENLDQVSRDISWPMQDLGLDLVPTSDRLAEFNQVENTYLSIFLILGSFGLVLGSIAIGIVVWRNVKERRGELALLRAIGYNRKSIQILVLTEHLTLLLVGIFFGAMSALLATLPAVLTPGSDIPYLTMLGLLALVVINGGFWTYASTFMATKEDLLPALRNE